MSEETMISSEPAAALIEVMAGIIPGRHWRHDLSSAHLQMGSHCDACGGVDVNEELLLIAGTL